MKLSPQTLRPPARMQSPAWFTERRRADWNGFRCAAIPLEPENLENQPGPPERTPQYIISFGIGSILCRCAAPLILGSETGPPSQNANPRLAHRAQQSGASGILEYRPSWPSDPAPPCQNAKPRLVHRAQHSGVEWIPRRGHSAWPRKSGKPTWTSRNNSPIQNSIWN